jgi:hypothetical protein
VTLRHRGAEDGLCLSVLCMTAVRLAHEPLQGFPARPPFNAKTPAERGFSHAAEWSRTITPREGHKALNYGIEGVVSDVRLSQVT